LDSTRRRYYTGDAINPLVALRYDDGSFPHGARVFVTVSRPDQALGNILAEARLGTPTTQDGDTIPARASTVLALEQAAGKPLVGSVDQVYELSDGPADAEGSFEANGIFGKVLPSLLTAEGDYSFHFRATYGEDCVASRELVLTVGVDVGIAPGRTEVSTIVVAERPDGRREVSIRVVPRDAFGNKLGPGRLDAVTPSGVPGTTVTGPTVDHGDGSYTVPGLWDPGLAPSPGLVITQPDRPPVVVTPPRPADDAHSWKVWTWILLLLVIVLLLALLFC
jgi:hypothetical protein